MKLRFRDQPGAHEADSTPRFFIPSPDKPFRITDGAIRRFTREAIEACLVEVQDRARQSGGLPYVQIFDAEGEDNLYLVDDDGEGAITACLGSEY
jgi:hypothetical protein